MRPGPVVLISAVLAGSAFAAGGGLTPARADRMVAACFAYASAHQGAVSLWVYDSNGEVIRFERMDGAPPIGRPFGAAQTSETPGDLPVRDGNETVGRVRVEGMGATGDRACAQAAAATR